jgi:hypothetical protein
MRYTGLLSLCIFGLLAATATGQQSSKPNFSGHWRPNTDKCQLHSGKASVVNLLIEQKDASIHVVKSMKASDGKESTVEFSCTTDGKDCTSKGVKVSLWYDGTSLVEMEIGDDLVMKTSMTLDNRAKTINADVTYISPQSEADKFVFEKM